MTYDHCTETKTQGRLLISLKIFYDNIIIAIKIIYFTISHLI